MSSLEKSLERKVIADLAFQGFLTIKVGFDGWPDRLVLLGSGRHIWFEFKTVEGKLRPSQLNRIKQLEEEGDLVYVIRAEEDAESAIAEAVNAI